MSLKSKIKRLEKTTGASEKKVEIKIRYFLILSPTETVEIENPFKKCDLGPPERQDNRDKKIADL